MMSSMMEGVVVDTNDPQQMGRLKVWVPAIDGEMYSIDDLPWCTYVSPLAGQTLDYPAGPNASKTSGYVSYGMWAVPKAGALVVVGFLYNDPNKRVYVGSYFRDCGNRSLPQGRNRSDIDKFPLSDTYEPIQPQTSNLNAQFNGKLDASEAQTRGVYERQVAQDKTDKDGTEGYQTDVVDSSELDAQTYVFTTPGRHALIFQDHPSTSRARIKTAAGHQVILDDANERIYVSTARGASWIEMDQDGRIHVYAGDSFSLSSAGDINMTASGNINMAAGGAVNVQGGSSVKIAACSGLHLSGSGVNLESSASFNILAAGQLVATGSAIHLNGPGAESAECPTAPTVVPTHEPWTRAASKGARNKNWKA